MKAMICKKLGMTRIFDEEGRMIPVTLMLASENVVSQIKTMDLDGYDTVQIAMKEDKKTNQPLTGHLKKVGTNTRKIREFSLSDLKLGDKIELNQFEKGEKILVQSVSKGKGFAGTVKRHNFHTGPKTHGSDNYRQPGSIGSAYPQRVIKGRRMSGHMGHETVTVKNLEIVNIDTENKVLFVKGAVPGPNKSTVFIWSQNA